MSEWKFRITNEELGMKTEEYKPQISQMITDVFLSAFICAHLRLNDPDKGLREMLEKILK